LRSAPRPAGISLSNCCCSAGPRSSRWPSLPQPTKNTPNAIPKISIETETWAIRTPGVHLKAFAILKRQFAAYTLDRWNQETTLAEAEGYGLAGTEEILDLLVPHKIAAPRVSVDLYICEWVSTVVRSEELLIAVVAVGNLVRGYFMASAFGPRAPWVPGVPKGIQEWTPDKDKWELYDLSKDWSQADDLADKMPAKLADLKDLFLIELTKSKGLPVGGGLRIPIFHPELKVAPPHTSWTFPEAITRHPEFAAPTLGNKDNIVSVDVDVPANANGVIYALGGFSGGLALYVKDGVLSYEYNLFEIQRTHIKAKDKLPTGKAKIEVETTYIDPKPTGPLKVVLRVNGEEVASGEVPVSAPLTFTANDALDFGIDLGSPVGIEYYDQAPFKFNGTIEGATVKYLGSEAELKKEELKTERPIPMAD
jgi:hypothetical protein